MRAARLLAVWVFLLVAIMSGTYASQRAEAEGAVLTVGIGQEYATIQDALDEADSGDIIQVAPGQYHEIGQFVIEHSVSIVGDLNEKPVIRPTADTLSNEGQAWFLVRSDATLGLNNLVLDGNGFEINQAIRVQGNLLGSDVDFKNIQHRDVFALSGTAIATRSGATLVLENSTFSDIGRVGVFLAGSNVTASIFGNIYQGKGIENEVDYAIDVGPGATAEIIGNMIADNLGVVDDEESAAVMVRGTATIAGNIVSNGKVGFDIIAGAGEVSIHGNTFTGNELGIRSAKPGVLATTNWWGSPTGPKQVSNIGGGGDAVGDGIEFSPWCGAETCGVLHGIPTRLVFITQPGGASAGDLLSQQPVVAAWDDDGHLGFNFTGDVTLTLDTEDPGAALEGLVVLSSFQGATAFNDLSVTAAGSHRLIASADFLTGATSEEFTVEAAPLTITGAMAQDKAYDGTAQATVSGGDLQGVAAGDDVSIGGYTATFEDRHAGAGKPVTVTSVTLAGPDAAKYTVLPPTDLTADITPRSIAVTAEAEQGKMYGDTDPPFVYAANPPLLNDDSFAGQLDREPGEDVGIYAIGQGSLAISDGNSGANYDLTFVPGGFNLTPRSIEVMAGSQNKLYGEPDPDLMFQITGGTLASDDELMGALVRAAGENVGAYAIEQGTLEINDGNNGTNYVLTFVGADLTIMPRAVSVTAVTDTKEYDGTTSSSVIPEITLGGLVGDDTALFSQSFDTRDAGTDKTITPFGTVGDGNDGNNYVVTLVPVTTGEIVRKTLTLIGAAGQNKTYDGSDVATLDFTGAQLEGVLENDHVEIDDSDSVARFDSKHVGANKPIEATGITLTGQDAENYLLSEPADLIADITRRPLSLSDFRADHKTYDGTTDVTGTGFGDDRLGDDDLEFSYQVAFEDKGAGIDKAVHYTNITASGPDAGNYALSGDTGTATAAITPRALTISGASAENRVYDGNAVAAVDLSGATLTGTVDGDDVHMNIDAVVAMFNDRDVGLSKSVSVTGVALTGADSANYTLAQPAGLTASIMPRTLNLSGFVADDKIYDGTAEVTGDRFADDRLPGDELEFSFGAAFEDRNAGAGKPVHFSSIAINGGADAGNYALVATTGTATASISPATLTITAVPDAKPYDGTAASSAAPFVSGLQSDDIVTGLEQQFAGRNAGTGKKLSVVAFTINDGNGGDNYDVVLQIDDSGAILPKEITVDGITAGDKIYDGTTAAELRMDDAALVGLVNGDQVSLDTAEAVWTFTDRHVGRDKQVIVDGLTLTGHDAANYSLVQPAAIASISPRTLNVAVTAPDKLYDGAAAAVVSLDDDRLDGDDLSVSFIVAAFDDAQPGIDKPVTVEGLTVSGSDAANYVPTSMTATTTAAIFDLIISLDEGWGLVSAGRWASHVALVESDIDAWLAFEAGEWITSSQTIRAHLENPASAVFIKATTPTSIGFIWAEATPDRTFATKPVAEGWNLIGTGGSGKANDALSPFRYESGTGMASIFAPDAFNGKKETCSTLPWSSGPRDATSWATVESLILYRLDGYWIFLRQISGAYTTVVNPGAVGDIEAELSAGCS